jgi:hypothetical protein
MQTYLLQMIRGARPGIQRLRKLQILVSESNESQLTTQS